MPIIPKREALGAYASLHEVRKEAIYALGLFMGCFWVMFWVFRKCLGIPDTAENFDIVATVGLPGLQLPYRPIRFIATY